MGRSISSGNGRVEVKICAVIPCRDHGDSLGAVLEGLPPDIPAIVVDHASDIPVGRGGGICVVRVDRGGGKARALAAGFGKASQLGFTHAITIDADGQHDPSKASDFAEASREFPDSIILGVRDFNLPCVPRERAFMNKFSNFWFWAETGKRIGDTQCGYRSYPLSLLRRLRCRFGGFTFETEVLVRAVWAGFSIKEIPIPTIYSGAHSNYRAVSDTAKFSLMNARLFFMSLVLSRKRLRAISLRAGGSGRNCVEK